MHNVQPDIRRSAAPAHAGAQASPVALPSEVLARIERELARCVGPVAGTLVRRAAQRHATPEALVLALAPSIEGAAERDGFVRACTAQTPRRTAGPAAAPTLRATPPAPKPKPMPAPAPARRAPLLTPIRISPLPSQREHKASDRRRRGAAVSPLSPHWRGIATRGPRDMAMLPLWTAVALSGALLLASWFTLNTRLDARARPLFASIAAVPVALQAHAAAPAVKPRLAAALSLDTPAGPIEVRDEAQRSLIVVPADALFADGSTNLDDRAAVLLTRIAQALRGHIKQGRATAELAVIGHGDAASPSLKFPSNWHYTRARAQAVADALATHGVAPVRAEGRAEFEPRAPQAGQSSDAQRARNRRIEIELRLPRPEELQP